MTIKKKIILVDIIDPRISKKEAKSSLEEITSLVETYGGFVVVTKIQKRQTPDYKTFIGSGKLQEILSIAQEKKADYIIFNNILKAQQLFNIEFQIETKGIKVWDRVDLILKIFAKHATSSESKLQIELASLRHMGPRIFGMGMELSRQGGGIGTRGKGETNTEIMKRHIAQQEKKILEKLKKIQQRHEGQRAARKRKNLQTIAIIGYTNAGKSQLLKALTKKEVKIKDELFATLDTRIGQLYLPKIQSSCLVSDTIGFIQKLPPSLIDAFKSTLDETIHADLLLHVIDYSDSEREKKVSVVQKILQDLNTDHIPQIMVCNKIDQIKDLKNKSFLKRYKKYNPSFISALKKQNISELTGKITEKMEKN